MPEGPCFNQLWSAELLKNVTPRRANNRVRKVCQEYYWIEPGYVFRDVPILLSAPMLIGLDDGAGRILMPFRKPCFGVSLYIIDAGPGEIDRLRADLIPAPAPELAKRPAPSRRRSGKAVSPGTG
ncbi:MAG: DUF1894 domain-containing protein [Methanoregulaceae archaeon]|jgi:hypothetical protein